MIKLRNVWSILRRWNSGWPLPVDFVVVKSLYQRHLRPAPELRKCRLLAGNVGTDCKTGISDSTVTEIWRKIGKLPFLSHSLQFNEIGSNRPEAQFSHTLLLRQDVYLSWGNVFRECFNPPQWWILIFCQIARRVHVLYQWAIYGHEIYFYHETYSWRPGRVAD